ncbi:MAG TPA: AAA family ATPase [Candidatus Eremiobacteraceae bacterium]
MRRGLVVGKFHPPHRGHSFLIETAKTQVDDLTVFVCGRQDQAIPAGLRAQWLRAAHPGVEVRVVDDILKDDDSEAWAAYCRTLLDYAPDAVFTSELYGDDFARFLECEHVCVDLHRRAYPCSASEILSSPLAHGHFLAPRVRAYFVPRIIVVGAESTGKTTLCQRLADHFGTIWVPEYGRDYALKKTASNDPLWTDEDFRAILTEQQRNEDEAALSADRVLICDTDSFATKIWYERYLGQRPLSWPRRLPPATLYLVTDFDVAFVQDGTRDGEHVRQWMHERFVEDLAATKSTFTLLSGDYETRYKTAVAAVERVVGDVKLPEGK